MSVAKWIENNETLQEAYMAGYLDGTYGADGYCRDIESGEPAQLAWNAWATPDAKGNGFASSDEEISAYSIGHKAGFIWQLKVWDVPLKRTAKAA